MSLTAKPALWRYMLHARGTGSGDRTSGACHMSARNTTLRQHAGREHDVIVVGGGTAGARLVHRLLSSTDARILVLEAGPRFPAWALGVPLASYRLSRPWSWPYMSVPQPALGGRAIRYPMGRVLGGSSSVNAMIAARGPASDYDAWATDGCDGWRWEDLQPYWQHATDRSRVGAVSIERPSFTAPFTDALIDAFEAHGLHRVDELTGERSGTCGRFALFQDRRRRYSTAHSLHASERSPRVTVAPGVQALRIAFDSDRAVGVECGDPRSSVTLRARCGVVLSAGVFGTPGILMRSGVGPDARLRDAGIECRVSLAGVGENLQDHIGVPVVWGSSAPSPGRKSRWIAAAIRYALTRTGVMASNGCEAGAFIGDAGRSPELELTAHFQSRLHPNAVEVAAIVMHPESRGSVTIDPRDPHGPPIIDPRFLSAQRDLQRLEEGISRIRDILSMGSLRAFGLTNEIMPGRDDSTAHIRRLASTHYHPVGTCRMGTDALSVVSPSLAVHGTRNVWVCDNSIVPRLPAAHSAATAIIIGERGGALIARQLSAS